MPHNDSVKIRRLLGFFKKQTQRLCAAATLSVKEYNVNIEKPTFENLDDDELEAFRLELNTTRSNLFKTYSRMTKLHDEWAHLQETDQGEIQLFDEYISAHGDYRTTITEAVARLEEMDTLLNAMDHECNQRNLSISSASSAVTVPDESGPHRQSITAIAAPATPDVRLPPTQIHDNSLLNFVDASILTKLELPTFDGNLLEYPEFASRFATLVGNKTQLDNTTKFSLLKSCLRGRALQSIQGLSMTPENFTIAMDILRTHYDDKVTMKHILYTKLAQLPDCDPEGRNLQILYNRMFALIRQFTNGNDDSNETALGAILINKLPARVKSRIYDMTGHSHNLSPSELLRLLTDIVRKEATLFEMDHHSRPHQLPPSQHHGFFTATRPKAYRQTQAMRPDRQAQAIRRGQKTRPCSYCNRNHLPISCDSFATPQQRSRRVKELRLCFNCLSGKHSTKDCRSKRTCKFCSKRHHSSLCFSQLQPSQHGKTSAQGQYATAPTSHPLRTQPHQQSVNVAHVPSDVPLYSRIQQHQQIVNVAHTPSGVPPRSPCDNNDIGDAICTSITPPRQISNSQTVLMCTPVRLFNPTDHSLEITVEAFLDSGSSQTYITEELAEQLQLPSISTEDISISTFGTTTPLQLKSNEHVIGICTENGEKQLSVKSVPTLTGHLRHIHHAENMKVDDATISICKPSILIGNDYFWDMVLSDKFYYETLPNGYRLLNTNLGKIFIGKGFQLRNITAYSSLLENDDIVNPIYHDKLSRLVSKFWELEAVGIMDNPAQKDDDICLHFFNSTITYNNEDGRYVVRLPFKSNPKELPDNYALAFSRLSNLVKSLKSKPFYMKKYDNIIKDQVQRRIIEEVPSLEMTRPSHYLSHHGVITGNNDNINVRCVFDGSAKTKGNPSINEILHRGPVLLPDLAGILIRCRLVHTLIISDIEKAFLMVALHEDCKDYTRFLWLHDISKPITSSNIVTYRFTRVPFGLICSPFLLSGTIHHHMTTTATPLSNILLRNTYVDNVFHGVNNVTEGKQFYIESRTLFQRAGMNLRKFASNSEELNEFFEKEEGERVHETQKLLGIRWNIRKDQLLIALPQKPSNNGIWTKRKVLKEVASVFDPLGFLTPSTLIGKLFLQSLWKIDIGWDDALPKEQDDQWQLIINQWTHSSLQLDRLIVHPQTLTTSDVDLHVFTDASGHAYCAVAYLVHHSHNQPPKVSLLMAKSRLAPLHQSVTIPRLELSAIAIGAKLLTFIAEQLDTQLSRKHLWSDSTVALTWIKTDKTLPVFVRNRVRTIRELTADVKIRYVPTSENPADIGCRGATIAELQGSNQWWRGPTFLTQDETTWPPLQEPTLSMEDPASQKYKDQTEIAAIATTEPPPEEVPLLDSSRFSTWFSLLATMIIALRFIVNKSKMAASFFGISHAALQVRAERILFRLAQRQCPPSAKLKAQLQLFFCEKTHLWKSQGRINNAILPPETKTPVFLPSRNRITDLFVLHVHSQNNHCGVSHTLTELRQQVWIPKGRTTVKRILKNICFYCKRFTSKPYKLPQFPMHPVNRVTPPQYPFQNTGMDFLGPMLYRTSDNVSEKYWIFLLTCLNTRAIYVDLVLNMSSSAVLHVLRRFIATVGCPSWILCDNAQSFKTIAECYSTLPDSQSDKDIIDYCSKKRIQIKFIPSLSPWQGGIYEKMVDVFKKSFKHAVRNRLLHIEDIKTLMKEAEAIVNTRPLTYVSDEINHLPLRPIDFLRPHAQLAGPYPKEVSEEWTPTTTTRDTLLKEWTRTGELLSTFWKRWTTEYLTSLREQYKNEHHTPRSHEDDPPKKGDYVLIHDPVLERGQWRIGQIVGSQDEFRRSVEIRLPSKKVISRPHNLVYKLEIHSENSTPSPKQETSPLSSTHPMTTRSKARLLSAPVLFTLLTCIQLISAIDTRCPDEMNTNKVILYATACVSRGIAIARYNKSTKEQFCWFPVTCPKGAIRFEGPEKPNLSLCGEQCKCPPWSQSCSFSNNWRTAKSTITSIPKSLLRYRPPHVCSFESSPRCDSTKKIGIFNQIQLFDNNTLIVEALTLSIQDYIDQNDFICVDRKGWIRRAARRITGTSRFCEKHHCRDNALLFCAYDNPVAVFVTNDAPSHDASPIIVKAWGTITATYYEYPKNMTGSDESPLSVAIRTQCSKGGLTFTSNTSLQVVEVCITSYCTFLKEVTSQQVLFPNSIIMYNYEVRLKAWHHNHIVHETKIRCDAHPICETLDCSLCWEWIYNTQCWTYRQTMYVILLLAAVVLAVPILCSIVKLVSKASRLLLRSLYFFIKQPWRSRKGGEFRRYTNQRQRHNARKKLIYLTTILLQIQCSNTCSEFTSIAAEEPICTIANNTKKCVFNRATVMTLQPLQQEACLELQDHQNEHLGTISITLLDLQYQCHKNIEFFSRDHEIESESVHRCYLAGSCSQNTCDNINTEEKLEEFSTTANSNPGFTYCTPSCGCLTCGGCLLCHPSCLFYRIYAKPTSSSIYTIFNCPSWELTATALVSLTQEKGTTSTRISLTPGYTHSWNHLRLTLIGTTTPQLPVLSSTFMESEDNIGIIKSVHKGQLIPNTAGQLQCATLQDAQDFHCVFAAETCKCANGFHKTSCSCPDGTLKTLMKPALLPQTGKNFLITHENGHVFAKLNVGSVLQLHIVMDNLKLVAQHHKSSCTFQTGDLTGCYSCTTGAQLDFACTSNEGETTAFINCQDQTQMAKCTPTTHVNTLVFHFSTNHVLVSCSASCPGGSANITIKGTLAYVEDDLLNNGLSVGSARKISTTTSSFFADMMTNISDFVLNTADSLQSFLLNLVTLKNLLLLFSILSLLTVVSCSYQIISPTIVSKKNY